MAPYPRARAPIADHEEIFESLFQDPQVEEPQDLSYPDRDPANLLEAANAQEILSLTAEQSDFVLAVLGALAGTTQDSNHRFVLEGPAGTGKTTTLLRLIRATQSGWGTSSIRIAAFTHKACSVLGAALKTWAEAPVPGTLHSLLNLKPKKVQYGQPEAFNQSYFPRLGEVRLLIVDECSMVGVDIYKHLEEVIDAHPRMVVVYAGDPHQLQPVNESRLSRTFTAGKKFQLTTVLRHDGAILSQATRIRTLKHVPQIVPCSGGGTEVVAHPAKKVFEEEWLASVVRAEASGHPADHSVMLCYTNDNRRRFNEMARQALHGPDVPMFRSGDVLVTLSSYEMNGEIVLNNNEDVVVTSAAPRQFQFPHHGDGGVYEGWELILSGGLVVSVIDPNEAKRYKKAVKALGREIKALVDAAQAARNYRAVTEAKRRWTTQYFPDSGFFAELDFRYALTIHKSQGSTYRNVFVCDDYLKSRSEAKTLLYVAFTRAAESVHLVDNRLKR